MEQKNAKKDTTKKMSTGNYECVSVKLKIEDKNCNVLVNKAINVKPLNQKPQIFKVSVKLPKPLI